MTIATSGASAAPLTIATKCLVAALIIICGCRSARAGSCTESLDYILNDLSGELPLPATTYRHLLDVCLQTSTIANVREAYLLRDGGIAVNPNSDFVFATAKTLADFCRQFPRGTLRIITRQEARRGLTPGLVVLMSSIRSETCQEIRGER